MPDALPGTILPIYPGLGQAPNMLACIPGGLVKVNLENNHKMEVMEVAANKVTVLQKCCKCTSQSHCIEDN